MSIPAVDFVQFFKKWNPWIMGVALDFKNHYRYRSIDPEDLHSIACIALIKVIREYGPRLGTDSVEFGRLVKKVVTDNIKLCSKKELTYIRHIRNGSHIIMSNQMAARIELDPSETKESAEEQKRQHVEFIDKTEVVFNMLNGTAKALFQEMGSPSKAVLKAHREWNPTGQKAGCCKSNSIPLKCYARGMGLSYSQAWTALKKIRETTNLMFSVA